MSKYFLKKIELFLFTIYLCATTIFFVSRLAPSDPVEVILGENASFEAKEELKRELNLDKPLLLQYSFFLKSLLTFNFGNSISTKRSILKEISEAFPETLKVGFLSFLFSLFLSIFMGLLASIKQGKFFDKVFAIVSSFMIVSPSFLLGPILLIIFAVKFPLFPIGGDESLWSYILPAFVLSVPFSGYSARVLRTSLLEEKSKPYFIASFEKGLSLKKVFLKHLLPNSLLPYVQISGIHLGNLLTGAIIVEKVFRINGIGSLLVRSVFTRDYPLLTILIILFSLVYLFGNIFADFVSTLIDPRLR